MPPMRVSASVCRSFASAASRSTPVAMTLASIGSYQGGTSTPASTQVSTRT